VRHDPPVFDEFIEHNAAGIFVAAVWLVTLHSDVLGVPGLVADLQTRQESPAAKIAGGSQRLLHLRSGLR